MREVQGRYVSLNRDKSESWVQPVGHQLLMQLLLISFALRRWGHSRTATSLPEHLSTYWYEGPFTNIQKGKFFSSSRLLLPNHGRA